MKHNSSVHNQGGQNGAGATIAATATALPQYELTRESVRYYLDRVFPLQGVRLEAMQAIVENSQIERRFCIHPVEFIVEPRPLEELSKDYIENSVELGQRVAEDCLKRAGCGPRDIDLLITVSCTGFMIPSLDAHLINRMGFRCDVRRLPMTELGCAAGAAGLARATEFLRAFPGANALLISVELPSLTFQRRDISQANLISSILFGDGAAAALVSGNGASGPRLLDTRSYTFPDSLAAMGFDLKNSGFHIVLSRDVPDLIRGKIKELVTSFLGSHGLRQEEMAAFVLHPGGQKLLRYIEEELGLPRELTQPSWDVLRDYGNLSSASVLFVLHEWLAKGKLVPGDYGLLAAFGPGFTAELLLAQWS
ncbi:MAG TPA: 3-oxoacyl-[acyl-carrier-protein] synthase III C-terminal domain-containing protein [Candidatus Acidoferrales bacterium]|nr:3-oxoacyl-[acyl-carrier-protein] synthase III C-terminal domain-containing protein [Candidatus Acidoferrales bacterium]